MPVCGDRAKRDCYEIGNCEGDECQFKRHWQPLEYLGPNVDPVLERLAEIARQRFAKADQIRFHAAMLTGEPFARATKARVNFVEDQKRPMFVAKLPKHRQELRWRNVDAASRLDRFNENRADLLAAEERTDAVLHFVAAEVRRL